MDGQMSVDLAEIAQVLRTRLEQATYENVVLTAALQQAQREVAELRGQLDARQAEA